MSGWSADYPTPASQRYRAEFVKGANSGGISIITSDLMSKAINRALERTTVPKDKIEETARGAGFQFAKTYLRLMKMDRHAMAKIDDFENYLLAAFGKDLEKR